MKGTLLSLFFLLMVLVSALAYYWMKSSGQGQMLEEGLSVTLGQMTGEEDLRIPVPVFRQKDERWSEKQLGPSSDTIGGYGCTLCCMAMALGAHDIEVEPDELNDQLMVNGGFTENSLLIWSAIKRVTAGKFSVVIENQPDHALIDRELEKGNPVIAKVLYDNRIYHWVLVTGKGKAGYLIADPLGSGTSHQTMTAYPSGIYAIRYLKEKS